MSLIVVGGQAKDVGKTTLVCNIIAAFPRFRWTAVKFTGHSHIPENSRLLVQTKDYSICQQSPSGGGNDTARYLSAGAARALLVQVGDGRMREACLAVQQEVSSVEAVLIESSSAAGFLSPDLYLMVLDSTQTDFKESARQLLEEVDGLVWREGNRDAQSEFLSLPNVKPSYRSMPDRLDPALAAAVASVLEGAR